MDPKIWYCPNPACDGAMVKKVIRRKSHDKTGEKQYAGEFYGCPNHGRNGCDYSVSPERGKAAGKVYRVYVLGEDPQVLDEDE